MTLVVDLDGTLCTQIEDNYESAEPIPERVVALNKLFDAGFEVIIFTARGSTTGKNWEILTKSQLSAWNVKYTALKFGKPFGHYYIDDKAKSPEFINELAQERL